MNVSRETMGALLSSFRSVSRSFKEWRKTVNELKESIKLIKVIMQNADSIVQDMEEISSEIKGTMFLFTSETTKELKAHIFQQITLEEKERLSHIEFYEKFVGQFQDIILQIKVMNLGKTEMEVIKDVIYGTASITDSLGDIWKDDALKLELLDAIRQYVSNYNDISKEQISDAAGSQSDSCEVKNVSEEEDDGRQENNPLSFLERHMKIKSDLERSGCTVECEAIKNHILGEKNKSACLGSSTETPSRKPDRSAVSCDHNIFDDVKDNETGDKDIYSIEENKVYHGVNADNLLQERKTLGSGTEVRKIYSLNSRRKQNKSRVILSRLLCGNIKFIKAFCFTQKVVDKFRISIELHLHRTDVTPYSYKTNNVTFIRKKLESGYCHQLPLRTVTWLEKTKRALENTIKINEDHTKRNKMPIIQLDVDIDLKWSADKSGDARMTMHKIRKDFLLKTKDMHAIINESRTTSENETSIAMQDVEGVQTWKEESSDEANDIFTESAISKVDEVNIQYVDFTETLYSVIYDPLVLLTKLQYLQRGKVQYFSDLKSFEFTEVLFYTVRQSFQLLEQHKQRRRQLTSYHSCYQSCYGKLPVEVKFILNQMLMHQWKKTPPFLRLVGKIVSETTFVSKDDFSCWANGTSEENNEARLLASFFDKTGSAELSMKEVKVVQRWKTFIQSCKEKHNFGEIFDFFMNDQASRVLMDKLAANKRSAPWFSKLFQTFPKALKESLLQDTLDNEFWILLLKDILPQLVDGFKRTNVLAVTAK